MSKGNTTVLKFEGESIKISPDVMPVLDFLKEIEGEIRRLEINNDFCLRSKFIVVFAYLETLMCMSIAYDERTSNQNEIVKLLMDHKRTKNFYSKYCLSNNNSWYLNSYPRSKRITAKALRRLRNSLTHFFSLPKELNISAPSGIEKAKRLENRLKTVFFLSPLDFYEITKSVGLLLIKKWSKDCAEFEKGKLNNFDVKINALKDTIQLHAAVLVNPDEFNI